LINFRYHIVSLIAVFLALGIGVIMGTSVIDRAVVDRLERQQEGLQADVDEVQAENNRLRNELREERDAARQLAEEGGELLDGTLVDVPVALIGPRGAEAEGFEDLVTLVERAGADLQGAFWLTDRFELDDEEEVRDLAEALDFRPDASAGTLRSAAINRIGQALRGSGEVLGALRGAGFIDFDAPEGAEGDELPVLAPGTRLVVVSDPGAVVPDRQLMLPLLRTLVDEGLELPALPVLAVGDSLGDDEDGEPSFVAQVRDDEDVAARVSSVDDLEDFAGRLAAVLALADLGEGRTGHYGRGPGAQRLLPAPSE
jgi:hypothetical protein